MLHHFLFVFKVTGICSDLRAIGSLLNVSSSMWPLQEIEKFKVRESVALLRESRGIQIHQCIFAGVRTRLARSGA